MSSDNGVTYNKVSVTWNSARNFTKTGLTDNSEYYYYVTAYKNSKESDPSNIVNETTNIPEVSNFSVTLYNPDGVDEIGVDFALTPSLKYETEIYQILDGGEETLLLILPPNTQTYRYLFTDGLTHEVSYRAKFKYDTTVLNVPTNLTLTDVPTGIQIDFIENNTEHDYIDIYANINSAGYSLLYSVAKGISTYTHVIVMGNTISYKIRAREGTLPIISDYTSEQTISKAIVDPDGNVYTQVTIGAQTWLVENWKSTKYQDGDTIPILTTGAELAAQWANTNSPFMSWHNGDVTNKNIYGGLYSHAVVRSAKGLCPLGWRIPTTADHDILRDYLGGASVAGGHLKEDGTSHWTSDNADNSSLFTALGGASSLDTVWATIKSTAAFWLYDYAGNYANAFTLAAGTTILTYASQAYRSKHQSVRLIKT